MYVIMYNFGDSLGDRGITWVPEVNFLIIIKHFDRLWGRSFKTWARPSKEGNLLCLPIRSNPPFGGRLLEGVLPKWRWWDGPLP